MVCILPKILKKKLHDRLSEGLYFFPDLHSAMVDNQNLCETKVVRPGICQKIYTGQIFQVKILSERS